MGRPAEAEPNLQVIDRLLARLENESTRSHEDQTNVRSSSSTKTMMLGEEEDRKFSDCTLRMQATVDSNDMTTLEDRCVEESEMHIPLGYRRSTFGLNATTTLDGGIHDKSYVSLGERQTTFDSKDATSTLGGGPNWLCKQLVDQIIIREILYINKGLNRDCS